MRKIYAFLLLLFLSVQGIAQASWQEAGTVQGRPYDFRNVPEAEINTVAVASALAANEFTFDDIEFWVGEGENKAGFVVQWNDSRETHALVWGYCWDGSATGIDMIAAVAAADPRFYCLSESGTSYGSTVAGMGYDRDGSANITLINPQGATSVVGENGLCPVSGYGYDGWTPGDPDDYWRSGWYQGYWSYWLKNEGGEWSYSGLGASSRVLTDGCWDGWNFATDMQNQPWKELAPASTPSTNYLTGTLILNEDWFGHNNSTMNFITPKGEWLYKVFQQENPGAELGTTSQFATSFGENLYILSKQPKYGDFKAGGRLIVVNAKTLKLIASFENIGRGDGRSFVGINPEKGYIATSNGIYLFDISKMEVGTLIEGTGGGSLYSGQIGLMIHSGKYVFAVSQKDGIYVIDADTDKIYKTIPGTVSSIAQSADGNIWGAAGSQLIKINPVTLATITVNLPDHAKIGSSWGAWNAGSFIADPKENVLYWTGRGASEFTPTNALYRYEIGNSSSLDYVFFTLPGDKERYKQIFYGAGVRLDSRNDQLVLTSTEQGWGSHYLKNYVYFVDKTTGDLLTTATPEEHYWFPAMPVIPDVNVAKIEGIESSYTLDLNDNPLSIDLKNKITDKDNLNFNIQASIVCVSDEELIQVTLENDKLIITPQKDQSGNASFIIRAISNGRITDKEVMVLVKREIEGVALDKKNLSMKVGAKDTLSVSFLPEKATPQDLVWDYSSYSIASVSKGIVTARGEGTGKVYVKTKDGLHTDTCEITVISEPLAGINLKNKTINIRVGQKDTLDVEFLPADASVQTIKSITAQNSNLITTATYNKTITGKAEGTTRVYVASTEGNFVDSCDVTVTFVHAEKLSLNKNELNLTAPNSETLKVTYSPTDVSNSSVAWTSSDPAIATVSSSGTVKAVSAGSAKIYAVDKTDNHLIDSCIVSTSFVSVTGITLNTNDTITSVGKSIYLTEAVLPENASNTDVVWTSSHPEIATVSSYGTVKGVSNGETEISVTTADGEFAAVCKVTVGDISVRGITLDADTIYVKTGREVWLRKTFAPSNASNTNATYSIDDVVVAGIDNYGWVKGLSLGETMARVTTEEGGYMDSCVVFVVTDVDRVVIDNKPSQMIVGDQLSLTATVYPEYTKKTVKWTSSDSSVATVDEYGNITALKAGECTVTVTSTDNSAKTDVFVVAVSTQEVDEIILGNNDTVLCVGDTIQLTAQILPLNATNKRIYWVSSNPSVATVSSRGFVTTLSPGIVTLNALSQDGNAFVSCKITVERVVTGVKLDIHEKVLAIGEYFQLNAVIQPGDATNKNITWLSMNEEVATVTSRGKVEAMAAGEVYIKAITDNGKVDSCLILAINPVTGIELNITEANVYVGDSVQLIATVQPDNASVKDVVWTSSNEEIAMVSGEGLVKILAEGAVVISATTADGDFIAVCNINSLLTGTEYELSEQQQIYTSGKNLYLNNFEGYIIQVINLSGDIILKGKVEENSVSYHLDIPAGTYILYGTDGIKKFSQKFMINH